MHKAHEKIWLQVDPDGESYDPEQHDLEDDCTWCKDQINENDVAYIRADLVANSLRQQLDSSQKREVMLRDVIQESLMQYRLKTSHEQARKFSEALAATADLDGLILCKKKPTAWCQDVIYEMAPEFAFSWVETQLHASAIRAWEPK